MARIFSEGFEGGDTSFWNILFGTNTSSNVRSGSRAWLGNSGGDTHNFSSSYSELYFRLAVRFTSVNVAKTILTLKNGATSSIVLSRATDNTLSVAVSGGSTLCTTTYTITSGTYYVIELYVKLGGAGVGVVTLRIDSIQRATNSANANNANGATIDRFSLSDDSATYDDLAMNDTTSGSDNSWCGDGHIIALVPNGAGDLAQWSVTGAANDYSATDEVPPNNDTDYISVATTNQRDCMNMADSGLSGVSISRLWVEMFSRIDVADGSTAGMFIRLSGTNFDDANGLLAQTLTYSRYKSAEWLLNPYITGAWTVAAIDQLQAGVRT